MKVQHLNEVPVTIAHDNLKRQRFIGPGELKSKVQTVNYVELEENESYTPHSHLDCEECFFVIEGAAEATIDQEIFTLRKNDFLVIAPNEVHTFKNVSKTTFKYFQFRVML